MNYTSYLLRRLIYMVVTLAVISVLIYIVIQLPPGDAVDTIVAQRESEGDVITEAEEQELRRQYGLDRPLVVQYADWVGEFLSGEMGRSIRGVPVNDLISERLGGTVMLSLISILFTYLVAIPIGIYSATHQYSVADYGLTTLGFIGLATPNFLLGLILLYVFYEFFGLSIGGFYSPGMEEQPWSMAKLFDLIGHLWIPVIVIGTAAHRRHHPGDARYAARRAGQAVRDYRPRQGACGAARHLQIPGAAGAEPDGQRGGQRPPGADQRRDHRRHRARPANARSTDVLRGTDAGHQPVGEACCW